MKLKDVLECLCLYDPSHPNYCDECDGEPRDNCYYDNCFYGRDELAQEILNLRELLKLKADKEI